jgi:tetratricopeptide (TPR) repeat protein
MFLVKGMKLNLSTTRYIYAPFPFKNVEEGIDILLDIAWEFNDTTEKKDEFNVYSALADVFIRQKQYNEARFWAEKAITIYPENKFAA